MPTEHDQPEIVAPVRPDAPDARDLVYEWASDRTGRPEQIGPDAYQRYVRETWHQRGQECTGFALAAIANYLIRRMLDDPTVPSVSRRMLYESAQLHDDQDFEEGSTLRGALKGWQRTGVARDDLWPYSPGDESGERHGVLDLARLLDARHRPLLRYRRISHADIDQMKQALAEGHVLFAGAEIHLGWYRLFLSGSLSVIERQPGDANKGGHAFVIVGYDDHGFWVHNSWGQEWGTEGYAVLPYDDWIENGNDTWVVDIDPAEAPAIRTRSADIVQSTPAEVAAYRDMWPHLVVLRDDGKLAADGLYEMDEGSVKTLMFLFQERTANWSHRRLAIVSDAGYLPTSQTIERCRTLRDHLLTNEIYPIFVLWETSWTAELADELERWVRRLQPIDGPPLTLPLDRSDPLVATAVARSVARPIWSEVVRRSRLACDEGGGGQVLGAVVAKKREKMWFDLHLLSHGAGDLLQAGMLSHVPHPIATAGAIAPLTTRAAALATYGSLIGEGRLHHFSVISLDSDAEHADRVGPVRGHLLSLVADLLVPAAGPRPFGASDSDDDDWWRYREAGRYVRSTCSGSGHIDVGWNAKVLSHLLSTILSYGPDPRLTRSITTPVQRRPLVDPLAAAEAHRSR